LSGGKPDSRELRLVCSELNPALDLLRDLGLRLDVIYPADDPHTAILSRGAATIRLTARPEAPPPPSELPEFKPEFVLTANVSAGAEGRAGMLYRDLIPSRLGGRYIASHIVIPDGGPVADWVHFHRVALQLIFVRNGWARVVYEDQGEPFVMNSGDMVLQPPGIRHRVLESSPGLEVIEIGCPALHETFADHEMELPNGSANADRRFGRQQFLRHIAQQTPWTPFNGGEAQEIALRDATNSLAEARVIRGGGASELAFPAHDGELVFGFVLQGTGSLERGGSAYVLATADAMVIPPAGAWALAHLSEDFQLLQVTTGSADFDLAARGASIL
jgi:mannose-6-phosphate isomerase-like protein (cupin superfamily)